MTQRCRSYVSMMNTHAALPVTVVPARVEKLDALSPADRRRLGLVLGFLAGLAALGPIAAMGTALAGFCLARPRPWTS
jgi:hypothetical protein